MALATKCPHCSTIFRVAADQLKLRGGIVRCGSCHLVFDGNAALVEPAPKPTPVIPDVVAELAAPAAPVPAVSDYVHGTAVDFELELAAQPAPAAAEPPAPAPTQAAEVAPQPEAATPAVWRTAAAPTPAPAPAPAPESAAPQPAAEPSPDDTAKAAVARAFAAATTHAAAPVRAAQPKPAITPSLSALLSPDDAFSAAIGESPAVAPPKPVLPPPAPIVPPAVVPPVVAPATVIDDKLLMWEDIPANESAASDAAAMAAVSRAFNSATTHLGESRTPPTAAAPVVQAPARIAPEPEPEVPAPALPVDVPLHVDEASQPIPPIIVEESPAPAEEVLAEEVVASATAEPAVEDIAPSHADEAEFSAPPGTALVEAVEQWSSANMLPDGRIEPMLDTPQEHIVLAALDDSHHFEDLPPAGLPVNEGFSAEPEVEAAAEAEAADMGTGAEPEAITTETTVEPLLADAPLPAADAMHDLAPAGEPSSLSEPETDQTALHAVAAVNTDAPDDGESLLDDEQAAVAARMRAIAGVDEAEDLDHSDLTFVKRVERSQKYGKAMTVSMVAGVPLLLAGLALQAGTTFRDTLAANYPQLKPALVALCEPLGCKVSLPAQLDALSVEQGELVTMAENTFSFSTVLRNQSKTAQAWPHIELTLNDNADKPVLRRVFSPREYLPSPAESDKGFGPHSEQSIKLYFELKELKASGYHIAIFYP